MTEPRTLAGNNLWEWFESDALPIDEFGFDSGLDAIVAIEQQVRAEQPTSEQWDTVRSYLGIPRGWKLRARDRGGWWVLTATGPRYPDLRTLRCGHRSVQVRAPNLPQAVARMAYSVTWHRRDCGG